MDKERKNHKQEYFRKLRENAFLLEEIAELKKELNEAKKYKIPVEIPVRRSSAASLSRSASSGSEPNHNMDQNMDLWFWQLISYH